MKIAKIFTGMTAAAMALTMIGMTASATKLTDVVYPTDDPDKAEINDGYYSIGAMGYFMSQKWKWNQSEWIGINDEGKIEISYSINEVLADTTLEGKGTLGDMGVMILNLPEDSYPYEVTVSDAKFTLKDGTEIILDSVNSITEATQDPESGWRIHIRPLDAVDEDTGEVTIPACPEVVGWDQEGAFSGGTLSMTIDFGAASKADDSSKADESSKTEAATTTKTTTTTTTTAAKTDSTTTPADNTQPNTGAADAFFALMAVSAAGIVVAKRNK